MVELGYDSHGRQIRHRRAIADLEQPRDLVAEETTTLSPSGLARHIDFHNGLDVSMTYDPAGRLLSIAHDTTTYWSVDEQDASGRMVAETFGNGLEQTYQRDILGQPTRVTIDAPSSPPIYDVQVGHTSWGAIDSVTVVDGVGLDHTATFTYDGAALVVRSSL